MEALLATLLVVSAVYFRIGLLPMAVRCAAVCYFVLRACCYGTARCEHVPQVTLTTDIFVFVLLLLTRSRKELAVRWGRWPSRD